MEFAGGGFGDPTGGILAKCGDLGIEDDTAVAGLDEAGEGIGDGGVIDDAFLRDAEGGDASGVGFDLAELGALQPEEAFEPVLSAALVEVFEAGYFFLAGGDDEFAADVVGDVVFLAEGDHLADAGHGHARFERAGFVVETTVEASAIVAALVAADAGLFFEDGDGGIGERLLQAVSGAEADQAASDDDEAMLTHAGKR